MGIIRKKEMSLSAFFLRFLICTVLSALAVIALWVALLTLAIGFDFILPANRVEKLVHDFADNLDSQTVVTADMIPDGSDYAIYNSSGTLQATSLSGSMLESADYLASSDQETLGASLSGRAYYKTVTDTQIIIFSYRLRAVLSSPALQRVFPDVETFELVFLFLLLVLDFIFVITHYAKKLSRELLAMQEIADQISEQNLDFTISRTRIREFNHVIDSFDHMRTELAHSLQEQWHLQQQKKKQMSALAHDIKTPLTIVKGNAELLQETALDDEQNSYNRFILQNAEQIQNYVTKMIEMAKDPDALKLSSDTGADVLFTDFLHTLLDNAKSLGQKRNLNIRFLSEDLPKLLPFPEESMKRILSNLLDNAIYYSPQDGTVTLHIYAHSSANPLPAKTLVMQVIDKGCGFSAEALKLGTEEFYRADNSRGSHSHFGMGLSITKQLVTSLGGTLCLGNGPDHGAVVTVELPLSESESFHYI